MKRFRVSIHDFKAREWTFYVADITEDKLTEYLERLVNGGYIESFSFVETEHLCIGLPNFSQMLIREGLA